MPKSKVRRSGCQKWNQDEVKKFFQEKFTVKDVLRMFHLTLRNRDSPESPDTSYDLRLQALLPDIGADVIMSDIELAKGLNGTRTTTKRSDDILAVPSDSVSDLSAFAVSDTPLQQEEELVEKEVHDLFVRSLKHRALPNSIYKKPPKPIPPPAPTYEEIMQDKMLKAYYDLYVIPRPRPKYPILPPRVRPPPPPEEPKGKKKKGKKGKKGKKNKKPDEPLDMTKWRKENLPVASTRLWAPWFKPALFQQYTPNLSLPPTPPGGVPQPVSRFGHFVNTIPHERKAKQISNKGHYGVTRGQSVSSPATASARSSVRPSLKDEPPCISSVRPSLKDEPPYISSVRPSLKDEMPTLLDLFLPSALSSPSALYAPATSRGMASSTSRLLTTSSSRQMSNVSVREARSSAAYVPSVSISTVEQLTRSITGFKP